MPERLEGWTPSIGAEVPLKAVVELAFRYRGNVTVLKADGGQITGYLFNRDAEAPEGFAQLLDEDGEGTITLRYRDIRNIVFSGKDTAEGNSYEAYKRRKEQARTATRPN
ncbi:MAG: hypothetical protein FJ318_00435 [SAR202 cluster bacterium]|nr:hypothetical protein [SAR202 cluster bacterium]